MEIPRSLFLKFKLDCILQDILDIKSQVDIIVNKKCCTISNLCGMSKFTILQEKLDGAFKEILVILQNLNQLVDNVLGQSIRILNEDFNEQIVSCVEIEIGVRDKFINFLNDLSSGKVIILK